MVKQLLDKNGIKEAVKSTVGFFVGLGIANVVENAKPVADMLGKAKKFAGASTAFMAGGIVKHKVRQPAIGGGMQIAGLAKAIGAIVGMVEDADAKEHPLNDAFKKYAALQGDDTVTIPIRNERELQSVVRALSVSKPSALNGATYAMRGSNVDPLRGDNVDPLRGDVYAVRGDYPSDVRALSMGLN